MNSGVPQTPERRCVCCGFTSANHRLFKRANTEWHGQRLGYGADDWICRSYTKCCEREQAADR